MSKFGHRILVGGLALSTVAALTACGGNSDAASNKLAFGIYPASSISLPPVIGVEAGIFEKNGLDVELIPSKTAPELLSGVIGDTTQVGLVGPVTVVPALSQGQELLSVPPAMDMVYSIAVTKDSGVTDLAGLKGKKIAVPARGGAPEQFVSEVLMQNGISPSEVEFVAAGLTSAQVPLIRQGGADAVIIGLSDRMSWEKQGIEFTFLGDPAQGTAGAIGEYGISAMFVTTPKFVDSRPEQLKSLCTSMAEITAWIADPANKDEGAKILGELSGGLSPEDAAKAWEYESQQWSDSLSDQRWAENVAWERRQSKGAKGSDGPIPIKNACA